MQALAAGYGTSIPLASAPQSTRSVVALLFLRRLGGAAFVKGLDVVDTVIAPDIALPNADAASLRARGPSPRPPISLSRGS